MIHLDLILLAIGVAVTVRWVALRSGKTWADRWQRTLGLFLFSPLLLLMTAIAVLQMGQHGQMLGLPVGEIGYACALGFLSYGVACLIWQFWTGWRSLHRIQQYPQVEIQRRQAYLLDTAIPFAAQVGFWRSELVVSQGLLAQLTPAQIEAVLAHEQSHTHYHDTFWFFGLNWLRQMTAWLPKTEHLWQELLLLREMRADYWAAQQVDAILVAETLLQMAQAPLMQVENACAAVSAGPDLTRLEERIESLLSGHADMEAPAFPWLWVLVALVPCLTIALHH